MVPMVVGGAPTLSGSYNTTGYYIPEEDDDALYNVSTEVSSISLHRPVKLSLIDVWDGSWD